jgi:hypothetical protein
MSCPNHEASKTTKIATKNANQIFFFFVHPSCISCFRGDGTEVVA